MEESELDDWFQEQREKLEEKVYQGLAGKNPARAKDDFDKQYRALIHEYQKRQQSIYDARVRQAKLQAPIAHLRERMHLFSVGISQTLAAQKQRIKNAIFEWKIKRILKDKSDL